MAAAGANKQDELENLPLLDDDNDLSDINDEDDRCVCMYVYVWFHVCT